MPETEWGWEITPAELESWVVERVGALLVLNKPAGVVCHPSKHGAWSSLAGAAREYLGATKLHMPFRLDRETSGVMLLTGDEATGRRLQRAVNAGRYRKRYVALLSGALTARTQVDLPIGAHAASQVRLKRSTLEDGTGQAATTVFVPLAGDAEYTLVGVLPATGRLHQIRVHAQAIGHPILGDKIYGPDESLFVEFIEHGWTPRHEQILGWRRQALHCIRVEFENVEIGGKRMFQAPLAPDIKNFCEKRLGFSAADYLPDFE